MGARGDDLLPDAAVELPPGLVLFALPRGNLRRAAAHLDDEARAEIAAGDAVMAAHGRLLQKGRGETSRAQTLSSCASWGTVDPTGQNGKNGYDSSNHNCQA